MALTLNRDLGLLVAQGNLGIAVINQNKSIETMTSGYRIEKREALGNCSLDLRMAVEPIFYNTGSSLVR